MLSFAALSSVELPFNASEPMVEILSSDPVRALRLATGVLHERLDKNLPLARVRPTLEDYRNHLWVLWRWQLALKPWLARVLDNDWSLALIAQDLADFPESGNSTPPPPPDLEVFRQMDDGSAAFCWGVAYVLEGSRLGGQVLYRSLSKSLAPHPLRYLANTQSGGSTWPVTLAALRKNLATEPAQASGCKGAVAAFELLIAQFQLEEILT